MFPVHKSLTHIVLLPIFIILLYVPWIHIVMMTPGTHCYYPINIHFITRTLDAHCYDDPRYTSLYYHYSLYLTLDTHCYDDPRYTLTLPIIHYTLCNLDTQCYHDPRYTKLLPIFKLSVFIISHVPWIHIAMMTPATHYYYPSLCYNYSLYLLYPGYTLLW